MPKTTKNTDPAVAADTALDALTAERDALAAERDKLIAERAVLLERIETSEANASDLREKRDRMLAEITDLKDVMNARTDAHTALHDRCTKAEADVERAHADTARYSSEADHLRARLDAQTHEEWVDIGVINVPGAAAVVLGTETIDHKWKRPQEASSRFAVDFFGPSAEHMATRQQGRHTVSQLADGTWRLIVPDRTTAQQILGQAQRILSRPDNDGTTVTSNPVGAGTMKAQDATRGSGAGLADVDGVPAIAAMRVPSASLRVRGRLGVDGAVVELRLG